MKRQSSLPIVILFLALLAISAWQGQRVNHLRDAERFYRWILSASTQLRLFGEPGHVPEGEDPNKFIDKDLFAKLVATTDPLLPDVPVNKGDVDKGGKPLPKIVRYTTLPKPDDADKSDVEQGPVVTEQQLDHDRNLWNLAQGTELANLRDQFLQGVRKGQVAGALSFGINDIYGKDQQGGSVSLANLFFGFRKMAANLIWLEVDRYFHQGMIHRMVPLMKTCVTLDPTFVDAFLLGAWHLSYNATAGMDDTPWELRKFYPRYEAWLGEKESYYYNGIEFLQDGIRKNPRNYKLYFDLGYAIYEEKLRDHPDAIKYLSDAITMDHDRWVRRQLYRILGENDQLEQSLNGWKAYLEWQPENLIAPRFIKLMEGRIKDRDADWAAVRGKVAQELAKQYSAAGDATNAAEWEKNAKAADEQAAKLFEDARQFWQAIVTESGDTDTFAKARLLRNKAEELRREGRYQEAIVSIDQARWASNEFWDQATHLMMQYKKEGNIPLAVTEQRQMAREEESAQYTRHLPKSVNGKEYSFSDSDKTWYQSGKPDQYIGQPCVNVKQGSIDELKMEWENPQTDALITTLDGAIVFSAGDKWYRYESNQPALPAKTDGLLPPITVAQAQ